MVIVEICVGSSCHLKGSAELVELCQAEVEKNKLDDDIMLVGSFCTGKCNRQGVTIVVNSEVYTGITVENFREFWNERVMKLVEEERG